MSLGDSIRECRLDAGMRLIDLANRMNTTTLIVYEWEHDIVKPQPKTLAKLAAIFGTTITETPS